jgi:hypothetical protein
VASLAISSLVFADGWGKVEAKFNEVRFLHSDSVEVASHYHKGIFVDK